MVLNAIAREREMPNYSEWRRDDYQFDAPVYEFLSPSIGDVKPFYSTIPS